MSRGGIEWFEVRFVTSLDADGAVVTQTEITTPDGDGYPALYEILGALRLAEVALIKLYDED